MFQATFSSYRWASLGVPLVLLLIWFPPIESCAQSGPDLARQIKKYESEVKKIQGKLEKIIVDAKPNSDSKWHRECDAGLDALAEIQSELPIAVQLIKTEKENWESIKSIGGELARLNCRVEANLKMVAKDVLQSKRDVETWRTKLKQMANEVKAEFQRSMGKFTDAENAGKLVLGNEIAEAPLLFDDFWQKLASFSKSIDQCKKATDASVKFYESAFGESVKQKEEFHKQITQQLRAARRQIEKLVSRDMVKEDTSARGDFEESIEKVALKNLRLYQDVLDDWVAASRPMKRDFDDFMFDAVGPTLMAMSKLVPKAALGTSLPSLAFRPDEAMDAWLDRVSYTLKSSASFLEKDAKTKYAVELAEENESYKEKLDLLRIRSESQLVRAKKDSDISIKLIDKDIKLAETFLEKNSEQSTAKYQTVRDRLEELREERANELSALKTEIELYETSDQAELENLEKAHESKLELIEKALKAASK